MLTRMNGNPPQDRCTLVIHAPRGHSSAMKNRSNVERGTIKQINSRGRVTVQLPARIVEADFHSGSGCSIGDQVEGDMRPGLRTWRNVKCGMTSAVSVILDRS
jgi:hypothetical protein